MTALDRDLEEVHAREHPFPSTCFVKLTLCGGTVRQTFTESDASDSHLSVLPPNALARLVRYRHK